MRHTPSDKSSCSDMLVKLFATAPLLLLEKKFALVVQLLEVLRIVVVHLAGVLGPLLRRCRLFVNSRDVCGEHFLADGLLYCLPVMTELSTRRLGNEGFVLAICGHRRLKCLVPKWLPRYAGQAA